MTLHGLSSDTSTRDTTTEKDHGCHASDQLPRSTPVPLLDAPRSGGKGKREEQIRELIQPAREQEHAHHYQDHASEEREEAGRAADRAQEPARTIHQEADQQKRHTQAQRIGKQEDDPLQKL